MIVNRIVEESEAPSGKHKRERFEIPPGSWAVSIRESREHWGGRDYVYRPQDTQLTFIGEGLGGIFSRTPNYCLLAQTYVGDMDIDEEGDGGVEYSRGIFWQEQPFAIIEEWQCPLDGTWVHMARKVNASGITKKLPQLELPRFSTSHAGLYRRAQKPGKWTRIVELAEMTGVNPRDLLKMHMNHFNGYDCGLHVLVCPTEAELTRSDKIRNVWSRPCQQELLATDMDSVWIRKQFAVSVMYLHSIGFHNQPVK